jgi:hypothetical protein
MNASILAACIFGFATLANAGPVTVGSTEAEIVFFGRNVGDPRQTQTAAPLVNEINDLNYAPSQGPLRGDARVFWSIEEFLGGLQIFVDVDQESFTPPVGAGGNTSFRMSFTSSVPLDYDFEASGRDLPASFFAFFDGISATLQYVGDGMYDGTIPLVDGPGGREPGTFARSGRLAAGTYTLELGAVSYGTFVDAENNADGFVRLNFVPAKEPMPIPLPSPLAMGAAALAALPVFFRRG